MSPSSLSDLEGESLVGSEQVSSLVKACCVGLRFGDDGWRVWVEMREQAEGGVGTEREAWYHEHKQAGDVRVAVIRQGCFASACHMRPNRLLESLVYIL